MSGSSTSSGFSHKFVETFKEACIILKSSSIRLKKSWYFMIQAVVMIHVLSIIIPPVSISSPPWDYDYLSFLWDGFGIIARPNYLREFINLPAWMVLFPLIGYFIVAFLHFSIFLMIYANISTSFHIIEIFDNRFKKALLRVEAYLRLIYADLGLIPTIFIFVELSSIFKDYGLNEAAAWVIFVLFAIPTIYFWVFESMFLQEISLLSNSYTILCKPVYTFHKRMSYILLILIDTIVLNQIHPIFSSISRGAIGLYLIYKFSWSQPYSRIQCSVMEAIKATMLVSSGIIHLLLLSASSVFSTDPTAVFMFFLALPVQIYILIHYMQLREKYVITGVEKLDSILHLYKNLLHQLELESKDLTYDKDRERYFIDTYLSNFGNNGWGILWIIYYFMRKKNYINVHILLSTSRNIQNSWECSIYIEEAKRKLLDILKDEDNVEWEGYHYVNYKEMLNRLMEEDKKCCMLTMRIYKEIVNPEIKSNVFSNHIGELISQLNKTKDLYEYLIKNFEKTSELLELYSGFLEILMNSPNFKDILLKGARLKEEETKQYLYKEGEVNFFYRDNMKLAVSLEAKNIGEIIWVSNANILGYSEDMIDKESFEILIPSPVREIHYRLVAHARSLWRYHSIFTSTYRLYMVHKNSYLVPIYLKERITNSKDNRLVMLSSVKINSEGYEIALLYNETYKIASWTSGVAFCLAKALDMTQEEVKHVNLMSAFKLGDWHNDIPFGEVDHPMMGKLCFKTGEYLMMKKLPIKAIYLRRFESYSTETKMLRYIDFFPDERAFRSEATRVKHSVIKIDTRVEEHHFPAIDEESKQTIQNELDDTCSKSLNDNTGVTRNKAIADDKSTVSNSKSGESMYKTFKNKIRMTKMRSSRILKKVKVGFVMSLIFNTTVYSVLFTVLQTSVLDYSEGTDTVSTLGNLRYDLLKSAYLARKLCDHDSGYQINETREEIIASLSKMRDKIKIYTNELKDTKVGQGSDSGIQFDTYVWWYSQHDIFSPGDLNIIDSSKRVNVLINNILGQASICSQPDFLELYRNTPFELSRNLNTTTIGFIASNKEDIDDSLDLTMTIFNAVINFKFFIKCVLILYIFTLLNNIRKKIFTSLLAKSKINLNIAMVKIRDRFIFLHNEDSSTIDIDERTKSKSRLTYCQHRYQKIVYLLITVVVSLMTIIIIFPNIWTIPNLTSILDEEVLHIYRDTELKNVILYGYFIAREIAYPISANLSNQYFINPSLEMDKCLSEIDTTRKLAFKSVELSTNIEEIYLGTKNLSNSLNTGMFEYMSLLRDMPYRSDSNTLFAYLESSQAHMENLVMLSSEVVGIIKDDSNDLLMNELSKIFEIIMLMIAVQGIILFTGFFPLLSKFERVLNDEIEILLYLPREDSGLHSSKYD